MMAKTVYGALPSNVRKHGETKIFTAETVPDALTQEHYTKEGVWGLICVETGTLQYEILDDEKNNIQLSAGETAVVMPRSPHRVTPGSAVSFKVEFYSKPS